MNGTGHAKVLGTIGRVYGISEPDALTEIEARAKTVDWKAVMKRANPADFRPADPVKLPRARRNRSYLVDMTYTLPFDIPDGKGGILYPKGYRFNPLDYVSFNQTLIVIDGEDSKQVAWLGASPLIHRPGAMILLTGGAFGAVEKKLNRDVFYADRRIVNRFKLVAVPSVIQREGRLMEVREVAIPGHLSPDR